MTRSADPNDDKFVEIVVVVTMKAVVRSAQSAFLPSLNLAIPQTVVEGIVSSIFLWVTGPVMVVASA
jgi:hypothetical protein